MTSSMAGQGIKCARILMYGYIVTKRLHNDKALRRRFLYFIVVTPTLNVFWYYFIYGSLNSDIQATDIHATTEFKCNVFLNVFLNLND